MPRRLRYVAQPFWNGRPGEPYGFRCAVDAEEGGRILLSQADGAIVYQQWVDDEEETEGEPDVLAILGEVPGAALMIDPPAPDPWEADAA